MKNAGKNQCPLLVKLSRTPLLGQGPTGKLHLWEEQITLQDVFPSFPKDTHFCVFCAGLKQVTTIRGSLPDPHFLDSSRFLVAPFCSQGATLHLTLPCRWSVCLSVWLSVCLVVCPWQAPLPPPNVISGQLRQF